MASVRRIATMTCSFATALAGVAHAQIRTPIATSVSTTPGPAPTNVRAVPTSPTSAALSWDVAAGTRYLVERRQADNPTCCVLTSGFLTAGGWQDGALTPAADYTFVVTALYSDGRSGSTQVMATTPSPPLSLGSVAYTACVQRRSAGPDPGVIAASGSQGPGGAILVWNAPSPTGTNYVIDRAPYGTTAWTFVGSTCGGPSAIIVAPVDPTTGKSQVWMRDLAGSAVTNSKYTYRITRIGPSGEVGWQTLAWVAPCIYAPTPTATVSGSTVTISWTATAGSCPGSLTSPYSLMRPERYTVTSSFGYVKTIGPVSGNDTYFKDVIYGVPVGTHTFSLSSGWRPDAISRPNSVNVTVSY